MPTSDWIKLRGNHAVQGSYVTYCEQVCLGPIKRATCTDFVAKVELLSTFGNLQQLDLLQDRFKRAQ